MTQHAHQHDSTMHHLNSVNIDPVCGVTVKPESSYETILDDLRYRFCSAKC